MRLAPNRVLRGLPLGWLLALVVVPGIAGAEIYRWTDAEGRLHFTERLDQVPPAYRDQARRAAARGATRQVQTYSAPASAATRSAARAAGSARRGGEIRVPFARDGSLMRVDAVLNDLVRTPFLVDTGASGISIPTAVAERLGIRIRPDGSFVQVQTANGVVARPVVTLRSVQLGGARVENLEATVNPAMEIGLLGGSFFNNFVYRVDAAQGVISLAPNENIRGGLGADEWRQRFRALRDPLERLESYLRENPGLHSAEQEELARRRAELEARLAELEDQANRFDVPQRWRD